jgi:hypothetical protein
MEGNVLELKEDVFEASNESQDKVAEPAKRGRRGSGPRNLAGAGMKLKKHQPV